MSAALSPREAFEATVGSSLECLCAGLDSWLDLRTVELLQDSDNTGDQAAVAAAKKLLQARAQKRAAAEFSESENHGAPR